MYAIVKTGGKQYRVERGQRLLVERLQADEGADVKLEPLLFRSDDAVAKIDGYIISIAGAAVHVGEKRMVRIDQVGRTAASALLLDESGEVITPAPRAPAPAKRRPRKRPPAPKPDADTPSPESVQALNGASPKDEAGSAERADVSEDGLQSKPRRRGRRGGRRRSAAKAKAGAADVGKES